MIRKCIELLLSELENYKLSLNANTLGLIDTAAVSKGFLVPIFCLRPDAQIFFIIQRRQFPHINFDPGDLTG